MKIGILTLARADNYGELLQNYGLTQVLNRLGHEPITIDFQWRGHKQRRWWERSISRRFLSLCKGSICRAPLGQCVRASPNYGEWREITVNLRDFEEQHLPMTRYFENLSDEAQLKDYSLDAYVVGSDQVWRPDYLRCPETFFLDFVTDASPVKKVAYAACWGGRNWTGSPSLTRRCASLLKRFDAVSVRNASAVETVKDIFGVKAEHVLDPTLLLQREDYLALIDAMPGGARTKTSGKGKGMEMFYAPTRQKLAISRCVSSILGKNMEHNLPAPFYLRRKCGELSDCAFPMVEDWLCSFRDADFIVTDSFHGMVFSLIFEKEFLVVPTLHSDEERFYSLARTCGFERRIYCDDADREAIRQILKSEIDYSGVKAKLSKFREKSLNFLRDALME